jgi:hypothetical protein
MAHFTKMVPLVRTQADRDAERERLKDMFSPSDDALEYPPGCCLCLTDEVLKKLDLDEMPELGDTIHLCLMAKVTEASDGKMGRRIELQVTDLACENEDAENESMSSEERAKSRYGADEEDEE